MFSYSILEIVLFFFTYCFIGWIWETAYVSVRKRKFINRGFMHGPIIPIYGFGAMGILFATSPFQENPVLIFIMGMLAASVLEYVTGSAMEHIFHVRYWDYSKIPLNLNGYISLPTSIVWGVFSLLMVHVIHKPIHQLICEMPQNRLELITLLLTMIGSMDLALSLREALDLKEILKHISEIEAIQKAQRRMDVMVAFWDSDKSTIKEKIEEKVAILGKGEFKRISSLLDRNPSAMSKKYTELFEEVKNSIINRKKS